MLDVDLASLYGVKTGTLNRAVRRNQIRLPADLMFQLTENEAESLRCQIGISKIEIMRTFVKIREMLLSNQNLARRLSDLEKKYDSQFKAVFDAIRQLMESPDIPRRRIGIINED